MTNTGAERTVDTVVSVASGICDAELAVDTDLIAFGFDSIEMIQLAGRLSEELGVTCSIEDVFETTSLGELARILEQRIEEIGAR
ncbi:acyl carrier protein [Streptomyces sp. NBC_01102]|uniref:acyl carrier protein n=1 Tax=unclassified Streptomyces TaxID=2593676 RepID=UPI00386F743C|nr:acyl carrier protein [Streptomyces sp. NBC_01102]